MIVVAFAMLGVLAATLAGETFVHLNQARLQAKWSICTMDPPHATWGADNVYAGFLSHYKVEAASDARYLHDALRKMLQAPVFLDSSSLTDLRHLITEGLHKADVLVILLTKGILTRPWCLLEIFEARLRSMPTVLIKMANGGFDFADARAYMEELPERLGSANPEGLALLKQQLGDIPLTKLQIEVTQMLDEHDPSTAKGAVLSMNSGASDQAMLASLQDLAEEMARVTSRTLKWSGVSGKSAQQRSCARQRSNELASSSHDALSEGSSTAAIETRSRTVGRKILGPAAVVIFDSGALLAEARVFRAELSRHLDREVQLGGDDVALSAIARVSAVVVLLTEKTIVNVRCVVEILAAIQSQRPIITITVDGGGFNFEDCRKRLTGGGLAEWGRDLQPAEFTTPLRASIARLWPGENFEKISIRLAQEMIYGTVCSIIAVPWLPQGGPNQTLAVMKEVAVRIPKLKRAIKKEQKVQTSPTNNTCLRSVSSC